LNTKIKIPLSRPDITEKEINAVIEVLKTPYLSLGPKLKEFEDKFAKYIGTKHAIAVSSGTAGLHLALLSLNIGENDAVITTPFSFIASANCILYVRATPIFVDIDPETYNIDPDKIEEYIEHNCSLDEKKGFLIDRKTGKRVRVILPVHIFGFPCDMDRIMKIANKYNLYVVEDACEAIGAEYKGKKVGNFGNLSIFAFYPNKQMTTGEGGMIVTNEDKLAYLCRSLRNQGRDNNGGWLAHKRLGYNYRISDINCALGIAQLDRIDQILKKRENIASQYNELFKDIVKVPITLKGAKRSWFVYVICLSEEYSKIDRDELLIRLSKKGIACSNYFPAIHLQPSFRKKYIHGGSDLKHTERISERTAALPFHNNLKKREIFYVANILKKIIGAISPQQKNQKF